MEQPVVSGIAFNRDEAKLIFQACLIHRVVRFVY